MIVIDACTIMSRVLDDEHSEEARGALVYVASHGALVPGNFLAEIINALAKAERRRRIDAPRADIMLSEILNLPLTPERADPHATLSFARAYGLTAYDAAYLALALQTQLPLATIDGALGRAATNAGCAWRPV